jgi:hypothetical protein
MAVRVFCCQWSTQSLFLPMKDLMAVVTVAGAALCKIGADDLIREVC